MNMIKPTAILRPLAALCFILALCNVAMAQSRYTVYKCNGEANIKKFRSDSWQKLSKNDALSLMDLVELKENSLLVILDSQNRKLYKSAEKGKIPVKYRIDAAVKNADKVTANLNAEIISELKEQNSEKGHTRIAAGFRGDNKVAGFEDSLAPFIKKEAAAISDKVTCITYPQNTFKPSSFILEKIGEEEQIYWLSIQNTAEKQAYINVVRILEDGTCSLCYEFGYSSDAESVIVPAKSKVELSQYLFLEADNERLVLLVTESPYDSHALQMLLK